VHDKHMTTASQGCGQRWGCVRCSAADGRLKHAFMSALLPRVQACLPVRTSMVPGGLTSAAGQAIMFSFQASRSLKWNHLLTCRPLPF
jgi:hypothetical protein